MQFITVFLDISKIAYFQQKIVDVIQTPGVFYVIYMFFVTPLDKI